VGKCSFHFLPAHMRLYVKWSGYLVTYGERGLLFVREMALLRYNSLTVKFTSSVFCFVSFSIYCRDAQPSPQLISEHFDFTMYTYIIITLYTLNILHTIFVNYTSLKLGAGGGENIFTIPKDPRTYQPSFTPPLNRRQPLIYFLRL